jgi:amino acid transporter
MDKNFVLEVTYKFREVKLKELERDLRWDLCFIIIGCVLILLIIFLSSIYTTKSLALLGLLIIPIWLFFKAYKNYMKNKRKYNEMKAELLLDS